MHISKQVFLTLFALGSFSLSFAQVSFEEFDLVQTVYRMEKREIFEEFLGEEVNKEFENLNKDYNKLITLYSVKIDKKYGGSVAIQFYQLEHYFLSITRTEIRENIPTIAEMLAKG